MRIAYVTRQYPPDGIGGIGTYVQRVATLMAERGHDVTVICASPTGGRSRTASGGVTVERFPVVGPAWLWDRLTRRSLLFSTRLHAALSARQAVRSLGQRFDVVEVPEWKAEGMLLPRSAARTIVVHLHLAQELVRRWHRGPMAHGKGAALGEWMERRTIGRGDTLTATSRLSALLPDGGPWLPGREVVVVPPPVVVDDWGGAAPIAGTEPLVLLVGHLEERKAPDVLMAALGELARDVPGLRAVFVGRPFPSPDGRPYDDYLRGEADRYGVPCEVLPPVAGRDAMQALYGQARVVAVPSRFETLSMVAIEALCCGRPAVMTTAVGASEWVGDALPELVVPPDDVTALAAALRPFLLDPDLAADVGARGRAIIAAACAPEQIAASREAVYEAALGADRD